MYLYLLSSIKTWSLPPMLTLLDFIKWNKICRLKFKKMKYMMEMKNYANFSKFYVYYDLMLEKKNFFVMKTIIKVNQSFLETYSKLFYLFRSNGFWCIPIRHSNMQIPGRHKEESKLSKLFLLFFRLGVILMTWAEWSLTCQLLATSKIHNPSSWITQLT